jgi:thymidine kinase
MKVWLLKPATDNRDGQEIIKSRIGLTETAHALKSEDSILEHFKQCEKIDVIIADECQFLTGTQIDELRYIVDYYQIPVLCFGLRTDFMTKLFPGSLRLFEVADSISEIKTICSCGSKAIVNARLDSTGKVLSEGEQVFIGGNESYVAMCHKCWKKALTEQTK